MNSLSAACTPLKHTYDACFNTWFESYLTPLSAALDPAQSPSKSGSASAGSSDIERNLATAIKEVKASGEKRAKEYEAKCGESYRAYTECVKVRVLSAFVHMYKTHHVDCDPCRPLS